MTLFADAGFARGGVHEALRSSDQLRGGTSAKGLLLPGAPGFIGRPAPALPEIGGHGTTRGRFCTAGEVQVGPSPAGRYQPPRPCQGTQV